MTESTLEVSVSEDFKRVAVVDDVFLGPTVISVGNSLIQFCAVADSDDEFSEALHTYTDCDFREPDKVSDEALQRLFQKREEINDVEDSLELLFADQLQRLADVGKIIDALRERGLDPHCFGSANGLFDDAAFNLVFLDYYLTKDEESQLIATELFVKFRSFIVLMSDKPKPEEYREVEESFRRKSYLLRGFFSFVPKSKLTEQSGLEHCLNLLPQNAKVCQSVQSFVDAIDQALGGPIPELEDPNSSDGRVLNSFICTLRSLALHDYAMLCELTLRDEGQPLGDYTIRLLGALLMQNLLNDKKVRQAVQKLDEMRFNEFLPCCGDASESLKVIYGASIYETVASPWSYHPWDDDDDRNDGGTSNYG